jgi:putative ABC transport system permease protein
VIGLSSGLAAAIFILLYVQDEQRYDKHHLNHDRIYRLESDITVNNNHQKFAVVPIPFAPAMKNEFPEIEQIVRIEIIGSLLFQYKDRRYYEENFLLADSTIFDVFTHPFILGDPATSLTEPNSIVLTQQIRYKYFGDENPVGKVLITGNGDQYKVTGVIEDLPGNSHLQFDALISTNSKSNDFSTEDFQTSKPSRFWRIGAFTYVLLKENTQISAIHDKFYLFYEKYMKELGDQYNLNFELMSRPLAETHFSTGLDGELPTGNKAYIYIFSAVAFFILLIAVINYMNMATARSSSRSKEIGIRKVLGAFRRQIIHQFISESLLLSIIATISAVILVFLLLPDFNVVAGKSLTFDLFGDPVMLLGILGLAVFIGIISGSYPSFYLSSILPVKVLKGGLGMGGKKRGNLRRILVIIQFSIAIFMIIGSIVVSRQVWFLNDRDMGFQKENLLFLELQDEEFRSKVTAFKQEILSDPAIISASNASGIPGRMNWIQSMRVEQESEMTEQALLLALVDYDFVETMGLEIIQGRNFDKNMGTDALEAVIINETAAYELGWIKDPIGKKIHFGYNREGTGGRMLKVIGMVKDFNFKSLHNKVEALIFFINEIPEYFLLCRINGQKRKESLDFLEQKWNAFSPKHPFNYMFIEQSFDEMYQTDKNVATIIRITALLTIFIALLGLLGLSSFIAEQKYKEIGIRKIHGATIGDILFILYREFAVLIIIAFILASPVAWWRLQIWLETGFVYYRPLDVTAFILAGMMALIIGLGTISFYIIRAASGNPIDAIKYE